MTITIKDLSPEVMTLTMTKIYDPFGKALVVRGWQ